MYGSGEGFRPVSSLLIISLKCLLTPIDSRIFDTTPYPVFEQTA